MTDEFSWGWEAPPTTCGRRSKYPWFEIAAALKENPGEWIKVENVNKGYITRINHGDLAAFSDGVYEAVSRVNHKGDCTCTMYVRLVELDPEEPAS